MKVDFYTYNQPTIKYYTPVFMANSHNTDWNSQSGKELEQILVWMGATAMAGINKYKQDKNSLKLDDEEKAIMEEYIDFNEETALKEMKEVLEKSYKETKDENILDKHLQIMKDAYKNKALLRGGYSTLNDYELTYSLINSNVVRALDLLGKGTLEAAFSLDLQGFDNFCQGISDMQDNISKSNLELLKKKINPESSNEYKKLEEETKQTKREISKLLGKENSQKRKELQKQIELLKGDKTKIKEVKELKKQIQNLYKNCKNSEQISALMVDVNNNKRKMRELTEQKVNLTPQEIINKVWTIASVSASQHYDTNEIVLPAYYQDAIQNIMIAGAQIEDGKYYIDEEKIYEILGDETQYYMKRNTKELNKDIKELIDLIQPSTPENDKIWNNNINKKLYEYANIKFNERYTNKIDLANCKYLNELIISDDDFWNYMTPLLEAVASYIYENPDDSIDDALDDFIHNQDTKNIFEARGIDYDKWSHYDKNSFMEESIVIKAEDAKQKAVKNMCDELTSKMLEKIPAKERKSLYKALSKTGVKVNKNNVKINGRDVKFDDLDLIMSVIKTELSNNNFWATENSDETIDRARDTIYCHFMHQRKQEIDNAKQLKDRENVDIKVQKVDMSNIKHSLCLGNHSHCCTALGSQSNEWSAPLYILNRCISAIEVLADGKSVGNTMIYLADIDQGEKSHLALVLDDIELQTKFQNNEKIKNMIIEYAKKLCAEIGKSDIPIYAGPGMHKVDMSKYSLVSSNMEIVGKTVENGGVYLDFDMDQHDIGDIIEVTDLYRIA